MKSISATDLSVWLLDSSRKAPFLLDVREFWEFDLCHIAGSQLIPMNTIPEKISTLDKKQEIICICHHGMRSWQVASFLESHGFKEVINLTGGVDAWAYEVDKTMPTY